MLGPDDIDKASGIVKAGLLASFGGLVGHLVDVVHRKATFSWLSFFVAILVAFFVGQVLGEWLPHELPGRDGILMVSGTSGYPVLVLLQERVKGLIRQTGAE